jgi:hypothetical protein
MASSPVWRSSCGLTVRSDRLPCDCRGVSSNMVPSFDKPPGCPICAVSRSVISSRSASIFLKVACRWILRSAPRAFSGSARSSRTECGASWLPTSGRAGSGRPKTARRSCALALRETKLLSNLKSDKIRCRPSTKPSNSDDLEADMIAGGCRRSSTAGGAGAG